MAGPAFVSVRRRERLLRRRSAGRFAGGTFGVPPHRTVNLINLDVLYGLSNRLSLDLTVPFAVGSAVVAGRTISGVDIPQLFQFDASGLGDMSLQAEYWLSNPAIPSRVTGSVGMGIKAPTGADDVRTTFPSGDQGPVDESAQLGTGGWELLLRAQGAAQIHGPLWAYGSGLLRLEPQRAHRCLELLVRFERTPTPIRGVWEPPTSFRSTLSAPGTTPSRMMRVSSSAWAAASTGSPSRT